MPDIRSDVSSRTWTRAAKHQTRLVADEQTYARGLQAVSSGVGPIDARRDADFFAETQKRRNSRDQRQGRFLCWPLDTTNTSV